jgi:ABC-2 type transport system permease protein
MHPMFVVAKRELLERIRTKWFVVVTLIGPALMVALVVIPAMIARHSAAGAKVAIADDANVLEPQLKQALETPKLGWKPSIAPPGTTDAQLLDEVADRRINGFIRVPADALTTGVVHYVGDNASSPMVGAQLQGVIAALIYARRADTLKLTDQQRAFLIVPPRVDAEFNTGTGQGSSGTGAFFLGYILAFIMYMTITLYCVNVMRSVVTEKSSRVMELMVAVVKPHQLMAGKILGVAGAALLQISVWLIMGALTLANKDAVLGAFGISGGGDNVFPPLGLDAIAIVIAYFVVGFLFYSSLFAAAGALVSSEQDTQQVQMPVTMILVIGVLCFGVVTNDPRGGGAAALTTIPLWSPMLMPMRYVLGGASSGDVALSLGVLAASTAIVVRAAAKIYRVGVLMYGKRPGLSEVLRWLRH